MQKLKLLLASRAVWTVLGALGGALGGEKAQLVIQTLGSVFTG